MSKRRLYNIENVAGCPSFCPVDGYFNGGICKDSQFRCSDIHLCMMKKIVTECLNVKESNNTGNEAWLLASTILSMLGVKE